MNKEYNKEYEKKERIEKSYTEINEIMKFAPTTIKEKYSKELEKYFKTNASKTYSWNYDITKNLNEQNISDLTRNILARLYKNYFLKKE